MKKLSLTIAFALGAISGSLKASENEFGVYKTLADFENEKITKIGLVLESENYNVGELNIKLKDDKIIKINCLHEKYFGFKYIYGNNYLLVDGIYAKAVIIGNLNLLISPKASYKIDENEHYSFIPAPNGSLSYYFIKDLSKNTSAKFERLISDDKTLLEKYKTEKLDNVDIIQKQIKYMDKYNSSFRAVKKSSSEKSKHKKKKKKR